MANGEEKGFKPATVFDEHIEKKEIVKKPKVTKKLAIALDNKDGEDTDKIDFLSMREKIKLLTDVQGRVESILAKEDLTPELKLKIEKYMMGLKKIYEKIVKISVRHISNEEKVEKLQNELGNIPTFIIGTIDNEIKKTEAIIDELAIKRAAEEKETYAEVVEFMGKAAADNVNAAKEKEEIAKNVLEETAKTNISLPVPKEKPLLGRIWDAIKGTHKKLRPERNEENQIELMNGDNVECVMNPAASGDEIEMKIKEIESQGAIKRVIDVIREYNTEGKEIARKIDEEKTIRENRIERIKEEVTKSEMLVKESIKSKEELQKTFGEIAKKIKDTLKDKITKIKIRIPEMFSEMIDKIAEIDGLSFEEEMTDEDGADRKRLKPLSDKDLMIDKDGANRKRLKPLSDKDLDNNNTLRHAGDENLGSSAGSDMRKSRLARGMSGPSK